MSSDPQSPDYQAGPPSDVLAGIGRSVSARLSQAPGVQRVPLDLAEVFVAPDFLDAADRALLIAMIDADSYPSTLFSDGGDREFRTSHSCNLDRWHDDVMRIDARICGLMGIAPEHGETLQGQRYTPGQQFKAHHDFFHVNQPYWPDQVARGGQRSWTAMIYLDQPARGGETHFPGLGISVAPRPGLLLIWNNMGADGAPNLRTLHAGLPVDEGAKHVVTKWFRERPWS